MSEAFVYNPTIKEVGTDILQIPFIYPEYAEFILLCCQEKNTWAPWKGDRKFSTYDIHLNKEMPEIFDPINDHLQTIVFPKVYDWWGIEPIEVHDLFALRYTTDTQRHLNLHHDDSFVSGSVKLNDNYVGGTLEFPRQKFKNKDVPVGDLLLWPGQITHPHESISLQEGEKYSLTIWTREWKFYENTGKLT